MSPKFRSLWVISRYTMVAICAAGISIIFAILFAATTTHVRTLFFAVSLICMAVSMVTLLLTLVSVLKAQSQLSHIMDDIPDSCSLPFAQSKELGEAILGLLTHEKARQTSDLTNEYLLAEAELNALYGQINPHFLYNTLEAICSMALMQNAPDVAKMTETLAYMFRNNMKNAGVLVTLEDELSGVENYMAIQQYRFPNKFRFDINISEENKMKILKCKIPHLTLQPIVENAIYHGLEMKQGSGTICLVTDISDTRLILQVRDNGCGMDDETLAKLNRSLDEKQAQKRTKGHKGVALRNIHLRLKKVFGESYGVYVMSTKFVGTSVQLTLPIDVENL